MHGVCSATGSLWCVVGPTMSSKGTGDWHSRVPEAGNLKMRWAWGFGFAVSVVESNCGMPTFLYADVLFLCELPRNVRERPRGWRLHLQQTLRAVQICEAKLWLRRSHRLLCEHCAGSGHFDGLCGRSLLPVNLRLGWERKMGSKKANRAQLLRLNRIENFRNSRLQLEIIVCFCVRPWNALRVYQDICPADAGCLQDKSRNSYCGHSVNINPFSNSCSNSVHRCHAVRNGQIMLRYAEYWGVGSGATLEPRSEVLLHHANLVNFVVDCCAPKPLFGHKPF